MRKLQELCIDEGYTEERKKGRDPNEPGMGSKMPVGRNSMVPKVQNKVAKGRGEEH
jgi:hypothetical protein